MIRDLGRQSSASGHRIGLLHGSRTAVEPKDELPGFADAHLPEDFVGPDRWQDEYAEAGAGPADPVCRAIPREVQRSPGRDGRGVIAWHEGIEVPEGLEAGRALQARGTGCSSQSAGPLGSSGSRQALGPGHTDGALRSGHTDGALRSSGSRQALKPCQTDGALRSSGPRDSRGSDRTNGPHHGHPKQSYPIRAHFGPVEQVVRRVEVEVPDRPTSTAKNGASGAIEEGFAVQAIGSRKSLQPRGTGITRKTSQALKPGQTHGPLKSSGSCQALWPGHTDGALRSSGSRHSRGSG